MKGLWGVLAVLTVSGTFYNYEQNHPHVLLAPLCILAVPLYDFSSVVLIRLSQGKSPFHADKNHFSHRLVEMGLSKPNAVLTIHLVTLTTGLGGLLLYHVPNWSAAALIVCMELCLLAVVWILEHTGRSSIRAQSATMAQPGMIPQSATMAPSDNMVPSDRLDQIPSSISEINPAVKGAAVCVEMSQADAARTDSPTA